MTEQRRNRKTEKRYIRSIAVPAPPVLIQKLEAVADQIGILRDAVLDGVLGKARTITLQK